VGIAKQAGCRVAELLTRAPDSHDLSTPDAGLLGGLIACGKNVSQEAERIIAIETVPERIAMARKAGATDIINFAKEDVYERIKEISKGEGADVVIDCVGMEASPGHGQGGLVSAVKEKVMPAERTYVLDQAIRAVRRAVWSRFPASTGALFPSTWVRLCRKASGCAAARRM
jgi:hypothetical protein